MRLKNLALLFALSAVASVSSADIADFEDLSLAAESYWNGSDSSGGFNSGAAGFNNSYTDWGGGAFSWGGFAYSNVTDTATAGLAGQFNAITGIGQGDSENYAVGFVDFFGPTTPTVTLDTAQVVDTLYVTNNNFSYYSMLNGDAFAKKFGGATGDDQDWFLLTITGKDSVGDTTGTVDFYLADFRFANNSLDYIVNTWESVDVTFLGTVKSLEFMLSSSDTGEFGMNTPAYFAMDNVIPEPGTITLLGLGALLLRRRYR